MGNVVFPHGAQPFQVPGAVKAIVDDVVPHLKPGRKIEVAAGKGGDPLPTQSAPEHQALVGLLELIAVHGIVEQVGKTRNQAEIVADDVKLPLVEPAAAAAVPPKGQAVTAGFAARSFIEQAKTIDEAGFDGPLRHLIGRQPSSVVKKRGQAETALRVAEAVTQEGFAAVVVIAPLPRAILVEKLDRRHQPAAPRVRQRIGPQDPAEVEAAGRQLEQTRIELADQLEVDPTCRGKIAMFGRKRAFAVTHPGDDFGDQDIEIGITLTMTVARHVDRNPVDPDAEVRAMVEVEAAQKILIGLAAARMLRGHHTRCGFDQLAGAQDWPFFEIDPAGKTFRSRTSPADGVAFAALHFDFLFEGIRGRRRRFGRRQDQGQGGTEHGADPKSGKHVSSSQDA